MWLVENHPYITNPSQLIMLPNQWHVTYLRVTLLPVTILMYLVPIIPVTGICGTRFIRKCKLPVTVLPWYHDSKNMWLKDMIPRVPVPQVGDTLGSMSLSHRYCWIRTCNTKSIFLEVQVLHVFLLYMVLSCGCARDKPKEETCKKESLLRKKYPKNEWLLGL